MSNSFCHGGHIQSSMRRHWKCVIFHRRRNLKEIVLGIFYALSGNCYTLNNLKKTQNTRGPNKNGLAYVWHLWTRERQMACVRGKQAHIVKWQSHTDSKCLSLWHYTWRALSWFLSLFFYITILVFHCFWCLPSDYTFSCSLHAIKAKTVGRDLLLVEGMWAGTHSKFVSAFELF